MNSGRTIALLGLLSVGPTVRPSAAQCPDGSTPPCRAAARAPLPAPNSVAVLYFDNLSPDTGDAYLAEGLTEAITARFGQIERLVVKSQTAVRRTRGRSEEHTSELQSLAYLVCRLLLEKKKNSCE